MFENLRDCICSISLFTTIPSICPTIEFPLKYANWHHTLEVGGQFDILLEPGNELEPEIQHTEYLKGFRSLQSIATDAYSSGSKLRAFGSKWSFNNGPYDEERLIQSSGLNYAKIGIADEYLFDPSTTDGTKLVFVQSGVMVRHLNAYLEANNLALITSGFGDGNRLVGAVQTGTHNSQPNFGSMQEYVVGIHLVLPQNKHVYLQKEDILKDSYATDVLYGADLQTNADLFNAAVVGAGSFGIIHGMVIQVAELYYLDTRVKEVTLQQLRDSQVLTSLYASDLGFDNFDATEQPYDLTIVINPFDQDAKAIVRACKQVSSRDDPSVTGMYDIKPFTSRLSDAVMESWQNKGLETTTENIPDWFIQDVYDVLLPIVIKEELGYPSPPTVYTPGELYSSDGVGLFGSADIFSVSMEIGVRLDDLSDILTILIDALGNEPVPTPLTIRYVKKSDAFLSLAKFEDITAMIDFTSLWDSVFFPRTGERLRKVVDVLTQKGFEHTYHLGKFQPLGNSWINGYGQEDIATWQQQRASLLNDDDTNLCDMFTNDWLTEIGLEDGCPI